MTEKREKKNNQSNRRSSRVDDERETRTTFLRLHVSRRLYYYYYYCTETRPPEKTKCYERHSARRVIHLCNSEFEKTKNATGEIRTGFPTTILYYGRPSLSRVNDSKFDGKKNSLATHRHGPVFARVHHTTRPRFSVYRIDACARSIAFKHYARVISCYTRARAHNTECNVHAEPSLRHRVEFDFSAEHTRAHGTQKRNPARVIRVIHIIIIIIITTRFTGPCSRTVRRFNPNFYRYITYTGVALT